MMKTFIVAAIATLLAGALVAPIGAEPAPKITICHAAGLAGTTHYIELTISEHAVFGPGGHFNENGTTQAGHEQDYMGPCNDQATATPTSTSVHTATATATASNTASPTATGTAPTATSTSTGTASNTPTRTTTPTSSPVVPQVIVVVPVAPTPRPAVVVTVPQAPVPQLPRSLPSTGNGGYLD